MPTRDFTVCLGLAVLAMCGCSELVSSSGSDGRGKTMMSTGKTADALKKRVRREGDRVWIERVRGWFVGDKESSVHAAQEAAMQAIGENVSYDDLVGVSGLAFRMQISKEGFCPSSPHSFCGYGCFKRSTQSLPWKVRVFNAKPEEKEKVAEARRAVVESIDRGVPVQYGSKEDGAIVGYQKNGEEWICLHPYREKGQNTFVETKWPWGLAVFTERKSESEIPSRKALAREALEQAIAMSNAQESGEYYVGFKAWDAYIERLRSLDGADDKTLKSAIQGNAWIYECLTQYRACAARYLKSVAAEFDAESTKHLPAAADLYEKMADQTLRDDTHSVTTIAPYPFTLKEGERWTSEMRKEQVRRLEAALPLERAAIAEIEAALRLIDSTGSNKTNR